MKEIFGWVPKTSLQAENTKTVVWYIGAPPF